MASNAVAKSDPTKNRSYNENIEYRAENDERRIGHGVKGRRARSRGPLAHYLHEQTSRRNSPNEIEIPMEVLEWAKKSGRTRFNGIAMTKIDGPAVNAGTSGKYSLILTTRNSYKGK